MIKFENICQDWCEKLPKSRCTGLVESYPDLTHKSTDPVKENHGQYKSDSMKLFLLSTPNCLQYHTCPTWGVYRKFNAFSFVNKTKYNDIKEQAICNIDFFIEALELFNWIVTKL